jgi:glycosyltransferase involved in cell wall biosynthesis
MNTSNLVSVIIPAFNRADLIVATVQSVYRQTYRPIECLIIDDGSTDTTVAVIKRIQLQLSAEDFEIHLYNQTNSGAPAARNNGIRNASGAFVQFLDSDDILYPNKIEQQVLIMINNNKIDGVYGDWHHGTTEVHRLIKGEKWEDTISQFYGGRVIHTLSFLFRRSMVQLIGPWDEALKRNQEVDFNLRGALAGGNFEYLPTTTGLWREHDGERIVSTSGALKAIEFHEKWIREFTSMGLMTTQRKKTAAHYLFWHSMELDKDHTKEALQHLSKALNLYQGFPEFNTLKMRLFRTLFGTKLSLKLWYARAKSKAS